MLTLILLQGRFGIYRLRPYEQPPARVWESRFLSITRTEDELSVVCEQHLVENAADHNGPWRCFKVQGPLAFSLTGVLSSLTDPLAKAGVSVFAVSTYDTDYLLVRTEEAQRARAVWRDAGHEMRDETDEPEVGA